MPRYYEFSVSLDETEPAVWRSFLLDADATFADLHLAIQQAAGWWNYHLYEFSTPEGAPLAALPDEEMVDWRGPVSDAAATRLSSYFDEQDRCTYVYDFGDNWQHTVQRTATVDTDEPFFRRLVGGARAFPPEDCGGIPGYEQCVAVARGQEPAEAWVEVDELREWMGDWHPDRFDVEGARAVFDLDERPRGPAPRGFARPAAIALTGVALPPRDELVEAAAANALLARLAAFTAWAGDGRKLTATGNLTLADGKALIDLLGTGDRFDERIGDRVFKTKSTLELPGVDYAFRLARAAGFVKVRKGSVSATKRGARLGADPLADWLEAFDGLVRLGVLTHRYADATWINPYWKELVDAQVPGLLGELLATGPLEVAEVHARLWALVEASFVLDDLDEEQYARHREYLEGDVRRICAAFADLGALRVEGVESVADEWGHEHEHGGSVQLTPLGAAGAHRLIERSTAG